MDVVRPADNRERREALELLLSYPNQLASETRQRVDSFIHYADKRKLSLEPCLIAKEHGKMLAACLCMDSPGRVSSVFIPNMLEDRHVADAVVDLLEHSARWAHDRHIQLLQGINPPEYTHIAEVYHRAQFEELAELIYLENDLTQPVLKGKQTPELVWRTYQAENHELFAEVVQRTYENSMDCGSLNGRRDIEDILDSHRATGEFDPRFWLIGYVNDEPVGVILLSCIPERWAYEVVYMGILSKWRKKGYGSAFLKKAIEMVREKASVTMTLTVDAVNVPAKKLYHSFGFREVMRRDVWIKFV